MNISSGGKKMKTVLEVDWHKRLSEYFDRVGYNFQFSRKDNKAMSKAEVQSFCKLLFIGLCSSEFIQMGIYKKVKKSK